jgi:hypothetical protein
MVTSSSRSRSIVQIGRELQTFNLTTAIYPLPAVFSARHFWPHEQPLVQRGYYHLPGRLPKRLVHTPVGLATAGGLAEIAAGVLGTHGGDVGRVDRQ